MCAVKNEVKKVRGYCAQCKSCCPTIAYVENGIFTRVLPDNNHPNANKLCPKGLAGPELVYSDQRLRFPIKRTSPKGEGKPSWMRISWDEALDTIAAKLNEIKANHGPEAVAFYRSALGGSPSRDFNNWVVRLAHVFGSPNSISTTHICNWHKDVSTAYTFGTGLEQNTNATQTLRALSLLYALTGNHDSEGSNRLFPRPPLNSIVGGKFLRPDIEKKRLGSRERPLGPAGGMLESAGSQSVRAADFYEAILTGQPYPMKGLVAFGGNLITANPDSLKGREALTKLDFYVQVDLFLTPAAELADIVLPASSFWEGWYVRGGFQQTDKASRHIQLREAVVPPQHDSRPDMEIIFGLAVRLGLRDKFWNGDIEAAFNHELAPTGIKVADLRSNPGGITVDLKSEEKQYRTINPKTGHPFGFNTPSKRVEIYSQLFKDHGYDPLPIYRESLVYERLVPGEELKAKYPLLLITSKVLEYCHGWGRALPMLRKRVPEPYVQINPAKAREIGLDEGEWVTIETPGGKRIKVKAVLTDAVTPNVICTQHGWWQSCPELGLEGYDVYSSEGANANLLCSDEISDPLSGSHALKGYPCWCRISKI